MKKKKAKKVDVCVARPYAVEVELTQGAEILGGGGEDGISVEDTLEGMADFPPSGEHAVVSVTRYEGVCFVVRLEREPRKYSDGENQENKEKECAVLSVWAPNEEDARELLQRTIRAHLGGTGWWEFDHPNYRRHAGTGQDEKLFDGSL